MANISAPRDNNRVPILMGVSNADGTTPVTIYADPTTHRLLTNAASGNGTVTSVSVVTANGVSGSVATATTTPAITLTLGAITPSSVNGLNIATTTGTLTIANGKTLTANNTVTFQGSDGAVAAFQGSGTVAYLTATTLSSLASIGTITTGTWNASVVSPVYGGTGVANNAASTLTISGNFATTLTLSSTTSLNVPPSGTLVVTTATALTSLASVGTITSGTWNSVKIGTLYGGTGIDSSGVTNGQLLIGNSTGNVFALGTLTGTTNQLTVTNGASSITLSTPQNTATFSLPTFAAMTLTGTTSLTVGTGTTNLGAVKFFNATNGNATIVQSGAPTSTLILTLPPNAGSNGQFLTTDGTGTMTWTTAAGGGGGGGTVAGADSQVQYNSSGTFAASAGLKFDKTSALYVGNVGVGTGVVGLLGTTSGTVSLSVQAVAGTWTMRLPTNSGTNVFVLSTDGSGTTSWIAGQTISGLTTTDTPQWARVGINQAADATLKLAVTGGMFSLRKADTDGATITMDWGVSNSHSVTLSGNRTIAWSNQADGQIIVVKLVQDATGNRTVSWPGTVLWPGGVNPVLSTASGKADIFTFYRDTGSSKEYGAAYALNL